MKRISLDIFRIGKTKDERKTRFEQSNEDRVNMNFRKLQQAIEEVNTEKAESSDTYTKAEADALLSAKANSADVVPKSGGTFSGDVTFDGVLDVTQRRCYATLSSAGWYRVLTYDTQSDVAALRGGRGLVIKLNIQKATGSENHSITLRTVSGGGISFVDESSKSYSMDIDKIRYTYDSEKAYIDIHYNASSASAVGVDFDVHGSFLIEQSNVTVNSLESVADAPSGETILANYDFNANISPTYLKYIDSAPATYTVGSNHYVAVSYPSGLNGLNVVSIAMVSWGSVTGAISIMPYGNTIPSWYIIGEAGVTLTNVVFRYWYI